MCSQLESDYISSKDSVAGQQHLVVDGKAIKGLENTQCIIQSVIYGGSSFPPWYPSFYPESIVNVDSLENGDLYVCRHCFKYTNQAIELTAHEVCFTSVAPFSSS